MPKWTKEQEEAIIKSGSNIIVSAGAGSGKTAVLSERVINKIQNGIHVNELLILTFTRAAADEMKDRIRKKISGKEELKKELTLLNSSYITTFDSFALSVVKKYHYLLNITDNINITDESIVKIQNKKILDEVLVRATRATLCNVEVTSCFNKGLTTTYEYLVKNDVVALYIYTVLPEGGKGQPASGNGLYKYIYFYNIKTDKIIEKYSEAARLMEVQDLGIAKNYDDLDNYGCINYSITNGTLKLVAEEQCV